MRETYFNFFNKTFYFSNFFFFRFIYPTVSRFEVLLVAPSTWEIVPETSIKLDEWEHVISFKNVHLAYEGTRLGFREYICLGTNYNYSEDITSRGRVSFYIIYILISLQTHLILF